MSTSSAGKLLLMKSLLAGMLDFKNAPGRHDQPEHGSWADNLATKPKVESTEARAARSTMTEAKPVVAKQKVSLKSASDVKNFYAAKGFKHAPSDAYLKKYYEGYEIKMVKNWAEVSKGLPEKYEITKFPPHENGKYVAERLGMTTDEIQEKTTAALKTICETGRLAIQLPTETLDKVLDDGRYKTQFETDSSMGELWPQGRAQAESKLFDYPANSQENPADRPIYGFIAGKDSDCYPRVTQSYGDATIILKDEVKERTTFVVGDSLDVSRRGDVPSAIPMPVNAPSHEACPLEYMSEDFPHQWAVKDASYINKNEGAGACAYIETQVHGGVKLSDIKEIVFSYEPPKAIRDKLQAKGVSYRVKKESDMIAPEQDAFKKKYNDLYKKMGR